ncbi:hypothetical protein [Endozoicomonas sp. OPT23]|uniref:hypothetical protein n=1 Tax=Endozoicomonas sp. OPT23 TaxID=2072845 RepID=UPI00129A9A78|nr:hypothetical protein [Endozoicomonas sp. OPT23]
MMSGFFSDQNEVYWKTHEWPFDGDRRPPAVLFFHSGYMPSSTSLVEPTIQYLNLNELDNKSNSIANGYRPLPPSLFWPEGPKMASSSIPMVEPGRHCRDLSAPVLDGTDSQPMDFTDFVSKIVALLADFMLTQYFYTGTGDEEVNLKDGYYGHMVETHTLSEVLYAGWITNEALSESSVSLTGSSEIDTCLLMNAGVVIGCAAKGSATIDKTKVTHDVVILMMMSKVSANMLTLYLNKFYAQFYDDANTVYQKVKAGITSSTTLVVSYLFVEAVRGDDYGNNLLVSVPMGHCLSCAWSNEGKVLQKLLHELLGDYDKSIVVDENNEISSQPGILSHLLNTAIHALIGIPIALKMKQYRVSSDITVTFIAVSGGHIFKGSAYALKGVVSQLLNNQYVNKATEMVVVTGGALSVSALTQYFAPAATDFRNGMSNVYAVTMPMIIYYMSYMMFSSQ